MDSQPPKAAQAVPKETLEKLAAKLKELVGEDFEMPNEQLVNEDGLPIIEFKEPVPQSSQQASSFRIPSPPPLKPLPKTEAERISRRKELDAFFEALEEEERQEEEEKEESEFMRVIREAKEKEEDARTGENTRLNSESQRRRVINGSQSASSSEDAASRKPSNHKPKAKKAVKFAGVEDDGKENTKRAVQWGDVQQGRLKKPIGMKSGGDIMKLEIVEKFPSTSKAFVADSDDEDEGDEHSDDAEDEDEEERRLMEDALHQREIALRYHELRQSLGAGPSGGPLGGAVDPSMNDEWDQEEVPLNASLAGTSENTRSQFNAPRLSDRALKAQLPNGLLGEIRPATIENDELVAPEDEGVSDEEIGPRGRRIIEGLKRGLTVEEVIGNEPEEGGHEVRKPEVPVIKSGTALMGDVVERERTIKPVVAPSGKPAKVSRFKANRME